MWLMNEVAPRESGMGHKLVKFHVIVHLQEDIILFGSPLEVDTGPNESGHKETKNAAGLTQRNSATFDFQTSTRMDEFLLVDLGMQEIAGKKLWKYHEKPASPSQLVSSPPPDQKTCGTKIHIFKDENNKPCYSIGNTNKEAAVPDQIQWDRDVLKFLLTLQEKVQNWIPKIEVRAEHHRHGTIFRGHPHYRDAHWRDWVMIDWGSAEPEPAIVWCFVVLSGLPKKSKRKARPPGLVHGHCDLVNGVFAVVECGTWLPDAKQPNKSLLFRKLELTLGCRGTGVSRSRKFFLVDVDAIAEACSIIPDVGCNNKCTYLQVKGRGDWVHIFEEWMMETPLPQAFKDARDAQANV